MPTSNSFLRSTEIKPIFTSDQPSRYSRVSTGAPASHPWTLQRGMAYHLISTRTQPLAARAPPPRQFVHISLGLQLARAILTRGPRRRSMSHCTNHALSPTHFVRLVSDAADCTALQKTRIASRSSQRHPHLPAKLAAEVQMQSGHALVICAALPSIRTSLVASDIVVPLAEKTAVCMDLGGKPARSRAWRQCLGITVIPGHIQAILSGCENPPPATWNDPYRQA